MGITLRMNPSIRLQNKHLITHFQRYSYGIASRAYSPTHSHAADRKLFVLCRSRFMTRTARSSAQVRRA
jgi:hypothetical protein